MRGHSAGQSFWRPQMDAMGEGVGKFMESGSYVLGCTRGYVEGHGVDFIVRKKNPPQLASDESQWTCTWNTFGPRSMPYPRSWCDSS